MKTILVLGRTGQIGGELVRVLILWRQSGTKASHLAWVWLIERLLDAVGHQQVDVLGVSLGGVIAQQLAIHHADRVASITLAATWARADRALRAVFSTWRWAADQGGSIADVLQLTYTSTYAAEAWNSGLVDRRLVDAEVAALRAGRPGSQAARQGFTWTAWAGLQHNATDELPKVHVPALIIVGARDLVLGPDHGHQLAALLPDSRLELVPDAGHRPFEEQPAACNDLLGRFLERNPLGHAVAA